MTCIDIDNALGAAAEKLSLRLDSEKGKKYGWRKKSAGSVAFDENGKQFWLKVFCKHVNSQETKLWEGEVLASACVLIVKKPKVMEKCDILDGSWLWRCLVMDYVEDELCSENPCYPAEGSLPFGWIEKIGENLKVLSKCKTDRFGIRQELVTRRMAEYYGPTVSSVVRSWVTGHNDLHFSNVTVPAAWILDWESWGKIPEGFDEAWLYCHSLANEKLSEMIRQYFSETLDSVRGTLALLFAIAELKRMHQLYGDYGQIQAQLDVVASRTLRIHGRDLF